MSSVLEFHSGASAKPIPSGNVTPASLRLPTSVRGRRSLDWNLLSGRVALRKYDVFRFKLSEVLT